MTTQNSTIDQPFKFDRKYWFAIIATLLSVTCFFYLAITHKEGSEYGWISALPTLFVLAFALITHRTVEALFSGAIMGLILLNPNEIVPGIVDISMTVMMDETIAWVILVCGLMGGLIAILEKGGSILNLSNALVTKVKSRRQSMLLTFVLGILVFIDDYLNAIAISSSMKRITDKYKISREKLAYLVDSTAAPICIIIPISTWAIFFGSLLEDNEVAAPGEGLQAYIQAIPYMAYGWVTLLIVFLVAMDKLPNMGPMKTAELRARAGQVKPDGGTEINFGDGIKPHPNAVLGVLNFILPMIVLVAASWYFDIDLLAGVFVAIMFTLFFYGIQRLLSLSVMFDAIYDGIKVMMVPLATVIGGFMLKNVNDQLGLTQYVIESVSPWLSATYFPAVIFLIITSLVFATASSWGLFAVAMPIVFPLGAHLDVPTYITIGVLLSASAAGSHSCFFSDSTVLSAQGSGCTSMQHAMTQLPYALLSIGLTMLFFFIIMLV